MYICTISNSNKNKKKKDLSRPFMEKEAKNKIHLKEF